MDRRGRVVFGMLLGGGLGLAYGLVAQTINLLALWGIPLYVSPPGLPAAILLSALSGSAVGIIACWPQEGLVGVSLASLAGALAISFQGLSNAAEDGALLASVLVLIYTFIPRLLYFLPVAVAVRWAMGQWGRRAEQREAIGWRSAGPVAGLMVVAMIVGSFSLYPSETRSALRSMDGMMRRALQAQSRAALPEALRRVEGFPYRAAGSYTLEWFEPIGPLQSPQPVGSNNRLDGVIIVRFENGYVLQCQFLLPQARPVCSSRPFSRMPIL